MAGTFVQGKPVMVISHDGKEFIATRNGADHDDLEQVPVF
jgi:hypothetical protein